MILDRPPKGWRRPAIPVKVKLNVILRQDGRCRASGARLGDIKNVQFDHRPGLWERKFDTRTGDTVPPANDPEYIEALSIEAHDRRTNGPGGEKRITTAGSDTHRRAKAARIEEKTAEFQRKVLGKRCGQKRKPKSTFPSRPFPKGRDFPKRTKTR